MGPSSFPSLPSSSWPPASDASLSQPFPPTLLENTGRFQFVSNYWRWCHYEDESTRERARVNAISFSFLFFSLFLWLFGTIIFHFFRSFLAQTRTHTHRRAITATAII